VSVSVSVCLALPFYIFIKTANKKKALLQLQMGLYYRTYLEGPSTVYGCADCGTHLATSESIISRVSSLITCFVMQSVEINSKLHHVAISRSTWSSLFVWKSVITVNNVNPKRRSPIAMIESISALVKQRTEIWRRDYIEFEIYHVFNAQRCSDGHMLVLEINMELIVYIWQRLIHMHLIH